MKTVSTVSVIPTSSSNDAIQTKPEPKGFIGEIKKFFKEMWVEMNRPLTEEERKDYNLFLQSRPYDPLNHYSNGFF